MPLRLVLRQLRVQEVRYNGLLGHTIMRADGSLHDLADAYLRTCTAGTARTYAYLLVDHLRWLECEVLKPESVGLRDLERYMGAVGAEVPGPYGQAWRPDKRPYGQSSLLTAAACLKGFYVFQGRQGINEALAKALDGTRLPTKADRRRSFLGHTLQALPSNPLTPTKTVRRRHPKMLPEQARPRLVEDLSSARDRMVVTWLDDGGFRIGELCGLHLTDLHLREGAPCGDCVSPHVHICHRERNANRARVKVKDPWVVESGVVRGGEVRRASPAMIHTYFEYITSEYPRSARHGMLLVQLHGPRRGEPWATAAARGMLRRAGIRVELGKILPKEFRHSFTSAVLDASDGNTMIAREAGGWKSAAMVEEVYGHTDVHDPVLAAALERTWEEQ
ncbi:tyrosine-type recombinase/integrase [Streptomyces bobili]|uniref:tyrosine-type recombinase/integrase n=1 Tax=Streptomyces bobili TaxID=67280 RepID=UPI0033B90C9E